MEINTANILYTKKNLPSAKTSSAKNPISEQNSKLLTNQLDKLAIINQSLAFRGNGDKFSYDNFKKAAKEAGINSMGDVYNQMTPENLVGRGANSSVYKFSDPKLDNWVIKAYKNGEICETYNDFGDLNMGQGIAASSFTILKKVSGTPHSIENWSDRASTTIFNSNPIEALKFLSDLEKIADFPQSSFDDYAKKQKVLSDKGYKMDSINPNNLLIDYDEKEINIIDYGMWGSPYKNSVYDLIMPLLDFSMYDGYSHALSHYNRDRLMELSKKIIAKCITAAEKNGVSTNVADYLEYINYLDKVFHTDTHKKRYCYMKNLFQELESLSWVKL